MDIIWTSVIINNYKEIHFLESYVVHTVELERWVFFRKICECEFKHRKLLSYYFHEKSSTFWRRRRHLFCLILEVLSALIASVWEKKSKAKKETKFKRGKRSSSSFHVCQDPDFCVILTIFWGKFVKSTFLMITCKS